MSSWGRGGAGRRLVVVLLLVGVVLCAASSLSSRRRLRFGAPHSSGEERDTLDFGNDNGGDEREEGAGGGEGQTKDDSIPYVPTEKLLADEEGVTRTGVDDEDDADANADDGEFHDRTIEQAIQSAMFQPELQELSEEDPNFKYGGVGIGRRAIEKKHYTGRGKLTIMKNMNTLLNTPDPADILKDFVTLQDVKYADDDRKNRILEAQEQMQKDEEDTEREKQKNKDDSVFEEAHKKKWEAQKKLESLREEETKNAAKAVERRTSEEHEKRPERFLRFRLQEGLCLGVSDLLAKPANGLAITLVTCNTADTQLWRFHLDGTVRQGRDFHYCLDIDHGRAAANASLVLWTCNTLSTGKPQPSQMWFMLSDGSLHPAFGSDFAIEVEGGIAVTQQRIRLAKRVADDPDQEWFVDAFDAQGNVFPVQQIKTRSGTTLCVDLFKGGAKKDATVMLADCAANQRRQQWTKHSDGTIRLAHRPAFCLEASVTKGTEQVADGAPVRLGRCPFHAKAYQKWTVSETSGAIRLLADQTLVMDMQNGKFIKGNALAVRRVADPQAVWMLQGVDT